MSKEYKASTTKAQVSELVAKLRQYASEEFGLLSDHHDAKMLIDVADLLEQIQVKAASVTSRKPNPERIAACNLPLSISASAVDPIPLSERKPGAGDLENGQAWYGQRQPFGDQGTWDWCYTTPSYGEESSFTHWLPASVSHLPTRAEG